MSSNKRMYVDFHVIQTVPPSCVNRDDTGSPKTAVFGGATRARISSQAWKHAMRLMFRELYEEKNKSYRTKKVLDLLTAEIEKLEPEEKADKLALKTLEAAGVKVKDNKGKMETGALFFISQRQIEELALIATAHEKDAVDKKEAQRALNEFPAIDIALFGRMVADDPSLNFDAAAQVAHAISTHAVHNEYDYFTAVDDCSPEDNAGAGHLGTVEFNSSTLYRYATVNVGELAKSLKVDTAFAVRSFGDAFIRSMPTGKQNTFANRTRPDAVYVTIRGDQPVNLAGAFEKPIVAGQNGYVQNSVKALAQYAEETYGDYVDKPRAAFSVSVEFEGAVRCSLPELLDNIEQWIADHINEVN